MNQEEEKQAKINASIDLLKSIGKPPVSTEAQREEARNKLFRNGYLSNRKKGIAELSE